MTIKVHTAHTCGFSVNIFFSFKFNYPYKMLSNDLVAAGETGKSHTSNLMSPPTGHVPPTGVNWVPQVRYSTRLLQRSAVSASTDLGAGDVQIKIV